MTRECEWCGDTHRSDQLCQRAQRGMTRRSFCFLFGAGVAGLALAPQVHTFTEGVLTVPNDWASKVAVTESIYSNATLTFHTMDRTLFPGRRIVVDFDGRRYFDGIIDTVNFETGEVHATDPVRPTRDDAELMLGYPLVDWPVSLPEIG